MIETPRSIRKTSSTSSTLGQGGMMVVAASAGGIAVRDWRGLGWRGLAGVLVVMSIVGAVGCARGPDKSFGDAGTVFLGEHINVRDRLTFTPSNDGRLVVTGYTTSRIAKLTKTGVVDANWTQLDPQTLFNLSSVVK